MRRRNGSDIWILDTIVDTWENNALASELTRRQHNVRVVDWSTVVVSGGPEDVVVDGAPCGAPHLAVMKARVLTRRSERDLALIYDGLEALEEAGTVFANTIASTRRTNNKLRHGGVLARAGIPIPPTRAVRTQADVEKCIFEWGEIVLKPVWGHASLDILRIRKGGRDQDDQVALGLREEIFVWHLLERYGLLIAQPFVPNLGRDIRLTLVGRTIADCNYHVSTAPDGTVRHFLYPWQLQAASLTPELEDIAHRAVDALGLNFATIDLVESAEGPVVIEVNDGLSAFRSIDGTEYDLTPRGHATLVADELERLLTTATVGRS